MVHLRSNYLCIYYVRVHLGLLLLLHPKVDKKPPSMTRGGKEQNMKPRLLLLLLHRSSSVVGPFEILNTGLLHNFISAQSSFACQDTSPVQSTRRLARRRKSRLPINNSLSQMFAVDAVMNDFCGEIKGGPTLQLGSVQEEEIRNGEVHIKKRTFCECCHVKVLSFNNYGFNFSCAFCWVTALVFIIHCRDPKKDSSGTVIWPTSSPPINQFDFLASHSLTFVLRELKRRW